MSTASQQLNQYLLAVSFAVSTSEAPITAGTEICSAPIPGDCSPQLAQEVNRCLQGNIGLSVHASSLPKVPCCHVRLQGCLKQKQLLQPFKQGYFEGIVGNSARRKHWQEDISDLGSTAPVNS